jgi:hypothetical protein
MSARCQAGAPGGARCGGSAAGDAWVALERLLLAIAEARAVRLLVA